MILLVRVSSAFLLLIPLAAAQTATTPTHHPVHHTAGSHAPASAAKANPADNPPGVPPVPGTPKPLYALRYVDTLLGTGDVAAPHMYYSVRYTGWLTNGTKFDSSDDNPGREPISFPYGARRVIPGWDTGFEGMHVGGKRRLYIPYQLAYGATGRPPVIPPKSDLIFDIELVAQSSTDPNQPPAAPQTTTPPPSAPSGSPPNPEPQTAPPSKPEIAPQH